MTELRRLRNAERIATALVLLLGAAQAVAAMRQGSMNKDGICYLDVGAAWLGREWAEAISATWSPLYALLLSPAALDVVPIGARLPLVHALNYAIFVGALVAFRALWPELGDAARRHADDRSDSVAVPSLLWMLVGYALFAWAALNLIRMWSVTPDMLLAGLLFAAAMLLLRQWDRPASPTAFLFGVVLGLGYLAKPVMFPLGIVFLCIAAFAWTVGRPRRSGLASTALAAAGFLLLALPWMTAVSIKQGKPTFGESGTLTYLRYINDVSYPFWTDRGSAGGEPVHPVRRIAAGPDVWAFGDSVVGGTYPPGFDPAYWYAGVEPRLDIRRQLEELTGNIVFTFDLLVRRLGVPIGALLVLLWLSRGRRTEPKANWRRPARTAVGPLALLAMGVAGVALYLPVLAEGRYLAAFIVLGFGGALAIGLVPASRGGEAVSRAAALVMIAGLLLELVAFNLEGAAQVAGLDVSPRSFLGLSAPSARATSVSACAAPPQSAESGQTALRREDGDQVTAARAVAAVAHRGTSVGVIGCAFGSYWAWLADLRVVAEMPADHAGGYWAAGAQRRAELDAAFAAAGARLLVAEVRPASLPGGWEPLRDTGLAYRWLAAAPPVLEPR